MNFFYRLKIKDKWKESSKLRCLTCALSTGFSQSMCTVRTTPEKFEISVFTLKTHQMFSVHTTLEKFENTTTTGHFRFVFEENSGREVTWSSWQHGFRKAPFKMFPSTLRRKTGVFKFLRFEERFRKAPFSLRISVDGRPIQRNKAAFSDFPA